MLRRPLYPIGVVAELLNVHPETIRVWERRGLINPNRRHTHRRFSDMDLKRLRFIKEMIDGKGFNLSALRVYLDLYPCWGLSDCLPQRVAPEHSPGLKPCWKEPGAYCLENPGGCDACPRHHWQPNGLAMDRGAPTGGG